MWGAEIKHTPFCNKLVCVCVYRRTYLHCNTSGVGAFCVAQSSDAEGAEPSAGLLGLHKPQSLHLTPTHAAAAGR
jgi:hypothetical protein